jgi:hypothetical protein
MMRHGYELGTAVSKVSESVKLWQTEKGLVEVGLGTLAVPIMLDGEQRGYVFHGGGKLVLDTIVETKEGAVGKPVEKELSEPFLMLSDTEGIEQKLSPTAKEDMEKMGFENEEVYLDRAEDLLDRFCGDVSSCRQRFSKDHGFVFAFDNQTGRFDILVADGSKLVYTAKDVVYVSERGNEVLKVPGVVLCSKNGKSVIVKRGKSFIVDNCACVHRHHGDFC